MMTPTRIVRMIGIAGVIGWMGLVGWVAKTTQAQNGAQNPPALPPVATKPDDQTKPAPATLKAQGNDAPAALPVAPEADLSLNPPPPLPADVKHHAAKEESPSPPTAVPSIPAPAQQAAAAPAPAAIRTLQESQPAASTDDPEQAAKSFVERSQKEAEDHLRALTAEAQQLRARLAKLESGIKKWQCLVSALKSSEGVQVPVITTANPPGAEDAGDLEPIKPNQAGGARADKRVKWATATSAATGASAQPGETVNPPQPLPAGELLQVVVPGPAPR